MDALKQLLPLAVSGSLAGLVLAVGLDAHWRDLTYLLRRPGRLARAVLVISVLTPAAAVILVSLLSLQPAVKAGIILLAISPVPPFVPGRDRSVGAARGYVYGLFAAYALLAVAVVPLSVLVMDRVFGASATIAPQAVAGLVGTSVLIPLLLGQLIRALAPTLASKAAPLVMKLSLAVLGIVCLPLLFKLGPAFGALIGHGVLAAAVLFALAALAFGHWLGGETALSERAALAITAGTRHPGIALLVANANGADKDVAAAVLLVFLTCFAVTTVYQVAIKRRLAHAAAEPPATA